MMVWSSPKTNLTKYEVVHLSFVILVIRFFFFFFFLVFLGPHPRHMEVPRLGVKSELQRPAYSTATATPDPVVTSVTYTTALGNTRSLAH